MKTQHQVAEVVRERWRLRVTRFASFLPFLYLEWFCAPEYTLLLRLLLWLKPFDHALLPFGGAGTTCYLRRELPWIKRRSSNISKKYLYVIVDIMWHPGIGVSQVSLSLLVSPSVSQCLLASSELAVFLLVANFQNTRTPRDTLRIYPDYIGLTRFPFICSCNCLVWCFWGAFSAWRCSRILWR